MGQPIPSRIANSRRPAVRPGTPMNRVLQQARLPGLLL